MHVLSSLRLCPQGTELAARANLVTSDHEGLEAPIPRDSLVTKSTPKVRIFPFNLGGLVCKAPTLCLSGRHVTLPLRDLSQKTLHLSL